MTAGMHRPRISFRMFLRAADRVSADACARAWTSRAGVQRTVMAVMAMAASALIFAGCSGKTETPAPFTANTGQIQVLNGSGRAGQVDVFRGYLVEQGFDPNYGARPLVRTIQRQLEDPMAEEILAKRL